MKIGIASDHRGIKLKEKIIENLKKNYDVIDFGTNTMDSVDYPDYAFKVGRSISNNKIDLGILICGTGIGMSIACNKVKNVRCAKVDSEEDAKWSKNDNDANVIAIRNTLDLEDALEIILTFINTPFSFEERHIRRVNKINTYGDK